MKRLLPALFLLVSLVLPATASEKANTVIIHPGETVYARFETKGKKLKLTGYSKEKDEGAQVVFSLTPDVKRPDALVRLKVENKLPRDLLYKAEIRSLTLKRKLTVPVTPVVTGKVSFEELPKQIEELAAYDFEMEK